ncbi:MAG TPA: tetratricopeptide repeat protein [Coleofasciculaceae cyanobacterium]
MTISTISSSAQLLAPKVKVDDLKTRKAKLAALAKTLNQLWQQADELIERHNYSDAIALFDKIIVLQPHSVSAWHQRGNSFANLGQYESAITSYNQALRIKPLHFVVRLEKTMLQIFLGIFG